MKRNLITLSLITVILATPLLALAQPSGITLDSLISAVRNATWKIFGIIAIVCFVVAGVLFLTAGGDVEKVAAAKSAFLYGVAGVVVGIVAFSIVTLIQQLIV